MTKMRRKKKHVHFSLIMFIGFVAFAVGAYLFLKQEYEIHQVRKAQAAAEQRIDDLRKEQKALEDEKKRLDDPHYIEKLARENYNMVGKDEVPLFIVEDKK